MISNALLPTKIVVPQKVQLNEWLEIESGTLAIYNIYGRSPDLIATIRLNIKEYSQENATHANDWVAYHALISDTYLTYAQYHRPRSMELTVTGNAVNSRSFNMSNILYDCYDISVASKIEQELSYTDAFNRFQECDETLKRAIETYMLVRSLRLHPHIIPVEATRWQIAMLISAMEYLMPRATPCDGSCRICGGSPYHIAHSTSDDRWDDLIFNRVKTNRSRSAYRNAISTARDEIRNFVIHEGSTFESKKKKRRTKQNNKGDGLTVVDYDTATAADLHTEDSTAISVIFQQTALICRYTILNYFIKLDIFPDLPVVQQFTQELKNHEITSINYEPAAPNSHKVTSPTSEKKSNLSK